MKVSTSWETVTVSDSGPMRLYVARPETAGPAPAILVFQEIFGVNEHIQDVAQRLAGLGFVAVAPELFHRTAAPGYAPAYSAMAEALNHMQALTNPMLEADIHATTDWLRADAQVNGAAMAAIGFCFGGKVAFIANALLNLSAAISFYGTAIPTLLDDYATRQHGPLMLNWGGKDDHIDPAKRDAIATALRAAEKPFTQTEFSQAGHGFFCDKRASYDAAAATIAWAMVASFLKVTRD